MNHSILAHTFEVDVTPQVGDYVIGGLDGRSVAVESQLFLRGLILEQDERRYVIVAVDYCYTCGLSHRRLEEAVADAAGVSVHRVTVHSIHVHDAPLINEEIHELFADSVPDIHNEDYFSAVLIRTKTTIEETLASEGTRVESMCFGSEPVHQFASSRRVIDDNNRCHVRWSVLRRPEEIHLKEAPEGKIDPMLDQILFIDATGNPFVALTFYACHPQVSNGRLTWSADTVGVARELFEKSNPGIFTMHFDGCGGDVTAGKYTTFNRHRNRLAFGLRLYDAMQAAFDHAEPEPLHRIEWVNHKFEMPLRREEQDLSFFRSILRNSAASVTEKYRAGPKYFKLRNQLTHYPFRISRLILNDANVLFLPAELSVEYQLYAKRRSSTRLATAAYGDCFLNYIATDEALDQGGYEVLPEMTEVAPGCEGMVKDAIDKILSATNR